MFDLKLTTNFSKKKVDQARKCGCRWWVSKNLVLSDVPHFNPDLHSVPSMVTDLTLSTLVGHPLEGLLFGGAPAPDSLVARAREAFPTATM